MQVFKTFLLALAVVPALGAAPKASNANIDNALNKMQQMGENMDNVKRNLENYQGGTLRALPVANAIHTAHKSAEDARMTFGNSDPFNDSEGLRILDAYNDMHPRLIAALQDGTKKAPLFKEAGVGYMARSVISNLYTEKSSFQDQMKTVLSPDHYQMLEPRLHEIDNVFKTTLASYAN